MESDDGGRGRACEPRSPRAVDYRWVMQVTFVVTVTVGAPLIAVLSLGVSLPSWTAKARFAVRVGAVIWLITGVGVYIYERQRL